MSTGDLFWIYTKYSEKSIESILSSFDPVEILLLEDEKELKFSSLPVQFLTKGLKNIKYCEELIKDFFKVSDMHSLGLEENVAAMCAVAMVLYYIQDTQLMEPAHIKKPKRRNLNSSMVLDRATIKNLELVASSYTGLVSGSLFSVIDGTSTQMGKRMLYSWVLNPLIDKKDIDERLDIVELFFNNREALSKTKELLSNVNDISRIAGKIGLRRANGRELKGLQISLENISKLRTILLEIPEILKELDKYDSLLNEVIKKIDDCIVDAPPLTLLEGGIIKSSYNSEIKELRELSGDSKGWIKEFEEKEKKVQGLIVLKLDLIKCLAIILK
jgi:DNA mismatch repair protein MutS